MQGYERRKYPRFEVNLRLRNFDLICSREICALTRDISAWGIGCLADAGLPVNSNLDIWLYLPDGETVHTEGKVVWVSHEGNRCRIGIELTKEEIKPIPLVLRTIRMKSRYYC